MSKGGSEVLGTLHTVEGVLTVVTEFIVVNGSGRLFSRSY